MPDNEDEKMHPLAALQNWLMANGKETVAFTIVMSAALWMFSDMRDEAKQSRLEARENMKEMKDREERAWKMRAADRAEGMKHADEMGVKFERMADSVEELVREIKTKKP